MHDHPATSGEDQPVSRAVIWTLRLLCISVAAVAAYLAWSALSASEVAGCGGGGTWDCGHVLHSRWSKWLGLPVSVPAVSLYLAMFAALLFVGAKTPASVRRLAWSVVALLAATASLAAIWFISLQLFVIQGLCIYCMIAHTGGIVIMSIILWVRPLNWTALSRLSLGGAAGVAFLICGQLLAEPPRTHEVEQFAEESSDESGSDGGGFISPDELLDPTEVEDAPMPDVSSVPLASDQGSEIVEHQPAASVPTLSPKPVSPPKSNVENEGAAEPGLYDKNEPSPVPVPSPSPMPASESADSPKKPMRLVKILGGKTTLNVYQWPLIGNPEADQVLVELFDYTCPHCRTMHEHLKVARQRFGDQLAFLTLPTPLNTSCNPTVTTTHHQHQFACELANLAVAVWKASPQQFPEFHDWLFASPFPRQPGEAHAKAIQLVGVDALEAHLHGSSVRKYIKLHVDIYDRAGRGTVPKLMSTRFTIKGNTSSADELCRILERRLGLQPTPPGR